MARNQANRFIVVCLRWVVAWLIHPVTILSIVGPFYLWTRVGDLSFRSVIAGELLDRLEVRGILDYVIQLHTLVAAYIVFWIEVAIRLWRRVAPRSARDHIIVDIRLFLQSRAGWLLLLFLCIHGYALFYFFLSSLFASPGVFLMYIPGSGDTLGRLEFPPFGSPITWYRALLVLSSLALTIWERQAPDFNGGLASTTS
jgi:hypothetical protein